VINKWLRWAAGVILVLIVAAPAAAGPATAVAAGFDHTCAIVTGGGVMCWGYNGSGQLGDGTATNRAVPGLVTGLSSGVTAIAAGYEHNCVLMADGTLKCWGANELGQLGDGTTTSRRAPVAVAGLPGKVTAVTAGKYHTCAIISGGSVMCWGHNASGQIGDGTGIGRTAPTPVSGLSSGVTAVSAGGFHNCAIVAGGVRCWGENGFSQLGDGTRISRPLPVTVGGVSSAASVDAGEIHSCAVTSGGAVMCWGSNENGQLGYEFSNVRNASAVPGLSGASAVAANGGHTCAQVGGGVSCWGNNSYTPAAVVGLSGVTALSAGFAHNCALPTGGDISCWWRNNAGQLGDGTFFFRETPVTVIFPPTLSLDRSALTFGATNSGSSLTASTPAQTVRLTQSSGAPLAWTAASNQPWLTVSPASGSGSSTLSVAIRFDAGLPASGTVTGTISFTAPGAANTAGPIAVTLTLTTSLSSPPFGSFDTPAGDGTVLAGSVALTGWTLDNVTVREVQLWRDLQPGETTPPFSGTASDPRNGKVFIANATFVDGARPDVEVLYPSTPLAYRAGWGYLMLTWGLFGQGNGTYRLFAFGFDQEGNVSTIGTKTLVISNNAAAKPFGSIDTPGIGGDPGTSPNFGWALTPKVNGAATCRIPSNGVQVSIDSGPLQPVVYGDERADIAGAFPGFSNSAAAGGHFLFDWSTLAPGTHTIGWLVTDDCGRADGIGNRFFNVTTGTGAVTAPEFRLKTETFSSAGFRLKAETSSSAGFRLKAETTGDEGRNPGDVLLSRGYGELPKIVEADRAGSRTIEVKQGERIELRLPRGFDRSYQLGPVAQQRPLPIGSTWDGEAGILYWQPAPGFLGTYRIVFSNGTERINVRVVVSPASE
jgi:alpha-tubulin suppressor-like RCC1 family protein